MDRSLAVLGTGAIGSAIGADLSRAGYNVLLVDQWPAHVEAMKTQGLRVTMPGEEFRVPVQACHVCDLNSLKRRFDIVFLACKSIDTCWMVELAKPHLKADGLLVSTQNSLNDEWIAPIIGRERDIACAFELSAEVFEPGVVMRNTNRTVTRFVLGELNGEVTPRVQEVASILSAVGKASVSKNVWGAKWTKLVLNNMTQALGAVLWLKSWDLAQNADYLDLAIKLGKETARVGVAAGHVLEPVFGLAARDFLKPDNEELRQQFFNIISDIGKGYRTCLMQDLMKKRLTEVDYLNGLVARKGREVNIPTPLNEAVTALVHQIEREELAAGPANFEKLKQYL